MIFSRYKRGNMVLDSLMVLIAIVIFSLMVFFGYQIFGDMNTEIQADADLSSDAKDLSTSLLDKYPAFFDGAFVFLLLLLWGLIIVASFMVDSHPIFFIFAVLLFLFVMYIGAEMSNMFNDITTDDDLNAYRASFPMITWIMEHLLLFIGVIGVSVALVLYGKSRAGT